MDKQKNQGKSADHLEVVPWHCAANAPLTTTEYGKKQ